MSENKGFTQVPNEIFELLPDLRSSELKIMLVICRKTIGWQKESDRISYSQFQEITGLARDSVANAIQSLEDKGLIQVNRSCNTSSYQLTDSSKIKPVQKSNQFENQTKAVQKSNHDSPNIQPKVVGKSDTQKKEINYAKETNTKYTISDSEKWNGEDPIDYVSFVEKWNELYETSLRITAKKREQIRARLQTWTGSEILKAWTNRLSDPYLTGEGSEYLNKWISAMRNDEKIERYQEAEETNSASNGINTMKLQQQLEDAFDGDE